ncbi:MAG TPA: 23S rRNA pseudouridine(1911/1915/1917) synthase RluD [Gammaproteobacteria bacterium]
MHDNGINESLDEAEELPVEELEAEVPAALGGKRLDQALAEMFPDFSRARLAQWVKEEKVLVDGKVLRPKDKVIGGEAVIVRAEVEADTRFAPQDIPLDVVYEDESILVVNKPAGLVVHPAAGNPDGTLLNALLFHDPQLALVPRAGIVHRLDKETSGLLVVARTLTAQNSLVIQLQERTMSREYDAVVYGVLTGGGTVDLPIGRHPVDRKRMAVHPGGKPAVTHYRVAERYRDFTHIKVQLETGRTHQIRVHMAHLHYPLLGDPVYAGRLRIPAGVTPALDSMLRSFRRQALHAARLGLDHPETGEYMEWEVAMPEDMQQLIAVLREDAQSVGLAQ